MRISTQELVWAAMFTAIMCVVTILVRVFQPVVVMPFSLQPLVMMLAAFLLTPRAVFLSMLAYLALGLLGLPVFSTPPYGGLSYVLIPSFGFLLGFPVAGWVQSRLLKDNGLFYFIAAAVAGMVVYYLVGLPYMYVILNFYLGKVADVGQILAIGMIPFIGFDLLKMAIAIFVAREVRERLGLIRPGSVHK